MGRGQGDHVGTGQPITFMCARLRRDVWWENRTQARRDEHQVTRTGRTKGPRHETHTRMLSYQVEYRCSCGHVGWTKHQDVLLRPEETP